jgi:hypothetical protein
MSYNDGDSGNTGLPQNLLVPTVPGVRLTRPRVQAPAPAPVSTPGFYHSRPLRPPLSRAQPTPELIHQEPVTLLAQRLPLQSRSLQPAFSTVQPTLGLINQESAPVFAQGACPQSRPPLMQNIFVPQASRPYSPPVATQALRPIFPSPTLRVDSEPLRSPSPPPPLPVDSAPSNSLINDKELYEYLKTLNRREYLKKVPQELRDKTIVPVEIIDLAKGQFTPEEFLELYLSLAENQWLVNAPKELCENALKIIVTSLSVGVPIADESKTLFPRDFVELWNGRELSAREGQLKEFLEKENIINQQVVKTVGLGAYLNAKIIFPAEGKASFLQALRNNKSRVQCPGQLNIFPWLPHAGGCATSQNVRIHFYYAELSQEANNAIIFHPMAEDSQTLQKNVWLSTQLLRAVQDRKNVNDPVGCANFHVFSRKKFDAFVDYLKCSSDNSMVLKFSQEIGAFIHSSGIYNDSAFGYPDFLDTNEANTYSGVKLASSYVKKAYEDLFPRTEFFDFVFKNKLEESSEFSYSGVLSDIKKNYFTAQIYRAFYMMVQEFKMLPNFLSAHSDPYEMMKWNKEEYEPISRLTCIDLLSNKILHKQYSFFIDELINNIIADAAGNNNTIRFIPNIKFNLLAENLTDKSNTFNAKIQIVEAFKQLMVLFHLRCTFPWRPILFSGEFLKKINDEPTDHLKFISIKSYLHNKNDDDATYFTENEKDVMLLKFQLDYLKKNFVPDWTKNLRPVAFGYLIDASIKKSTFTLYPPSEHNTMQYLQNDFTLISQSLQTDILCIFARLKQEELVDLTIEAKIVATVLDNSPRLDSYIYQTAFSKLWSFDESSIPARLSPTASQHSPILAAPAPASPNLYEKMIEDMREVIRKLSQLDDKATLVSKLNYKVHKTTAEIVERLKKKFIQNEYKQYMALIRYRINKFGDGADFEKVKTSMLNYYIKAMEERTELRDLPQDILVYLPAED